MLEKSRGILTVILTLLVIFGLIKIPYWLGSFVPDADMAPVFMIWLLGIVMITVAVVVTVICLAIFVGIYDFIDRLL